MKVLLVNTFLFPRGGDTTYTHSLATLLRARGHEVVFFGMRDDRNPDLPGAQDFVEPIDFVDANARKSPATAVKVLWRSIYSVHARRRIARLLDFHRPDVAHLQNLHAHITPSIIDSLRVRGVPVVWTLHDYKLVCPDSRLYSGGQPCEACRGAAFSHCVRKRCKKGSLAASLVAAGEAFTHRHLGVHEKVGKFIAPSRFLRDKFLEFGWDANRIEHVRNFLPLDRLERPTGPDEGYAVYLGGLQEWKGAETLLRAWSRLKHVPLKVLGSGEGRQAEGWLEGPAPKVEFLGHLRGRALHEVVSRSAFVCVPSECYENCPYVVMEAMAYGKPVLASRIGGLPELVDHGRTGFLFRPTDVDDLVARAAELASDPTLRRSFGSAAQSVARRRFHPDRHYQSILDVYASVGVSFDRASEEVAV